MSEVFIAKQVKGTSRKCSICPNSPAVETVYRTSDDGKTPDMSSGRPICGAHRENS